MTNSQLFKAAHAMAKQVHVKGESYQVTFGACLKAIKAELVQAEAVKAVAVVNFAIIAVIVMMVTKLIDKLVDYTDIVIMVAFIFFNPFSIILALDVYIKHLQYLF